MRTWAIFLVIWILANLFGIGWLIYHQWVDDWLGGWTITTLFCLMLFLNMLKGGAAITPSDWVPEGYYEKHPEKLP